MQFNGVPSFDEFVKAKAGESKFVSQMPVGEYLCQFLGVSMQPNKFTPGEYIPEYKFNIDGVEKSLNSASKDLWNLKGREGQTVTLVKTMSKDKKSAYFIK